MKSNTIKQMSYIAFGAGIASIALSGATYLFGAKDSDDREKGAGHFIGLWAPTFLLLAEMLDRVAVQDDSYLGVNIERNFTDEVARRGRELVSR